MKYRIFLASALLAISSTVVATPFTYYFTTPGWDTNQDPSLFGSALRLAITVDNGGISTANQAFNFSDIVRVNAVAIGGSLAHTYTVPYGVVDNIPFITTNSFASPVLRLGNQNNADGGWASSPFAPCSAPWLQLGQSGATGGLVPIASYCYTAGVYKSASYASSFHDGLLAPINIRGRYSLPAPPAWLIMLTGLGLLVPFYNRRHEIPRSRNRKDVRPY